MKVCCNVLQCVVVTMSRIRLRYQGVLQCAAAVTIGHLSLRHQGVLQCVAVSYSVLQYQRVSQSTSQSRPQHQGVTRHKNTDKTSNNANSWIRTTFSSPSFSPPPQTCILIPPPPHPPPIQTPSSPYMV